VSELENKGLMTGSVQLSSWTLGLRVERLLVMPRYESGQSGADVDHHLCLGPTPTTIPSCIRFRRQLGRFTHCRALQVREDALEPQSICSRCSILPEWRPVCFLCK
jgi:hypothetical protein